MVVPVYLLLQYIDKVVVVLYVQKLWVTVELPQLQP